MLDLKSSRNIRIGLIGYGYIAQNLAQRIGAEPGMGLAFVHTRRRAQAADISDGVFLDDISGTEERAADIIVEAAHPCFTVEHGETFLGQCDYLPLSTGALIDNDLCRRLSQTAKAHGTRLFLAAGALAGGEEMVKRSKPWERVCITFRKHPRNIDFSDVAFAAEDVTDARTIFEGPVREIAACYPRNVNTMVTGALLSTGVDACEGVLIADPSLDYAVAIVEAWGSDGSYLRTEKRQPVKGVSGTEMVDSAWFSLKRAVGQSTGTFELV